MPKMNKSEFRDCMSALFAAVNRQMPDEQMAIWYDNLCDLEPRCLAYGIKRWLQQCDSAWPTIAAIRKCSIEYATEPIGDSTEAFTKVIKAVSAFGWYNPPGARKELGPLIWAAVEGSGGWQNYCDMSPDNRTTISAQFRRAFESVAGDENQKRILQADTQPARVAYDRATIELAARLPEPKE